MDSFCKKSKEIILFVVKFDFKIPTNVIERVMTGRDLLLMCASAVADEDPLQDTQCYKITCAFTWPPLSRVCLEATISRRASFNTAYEMFTSTRNCWLQWTRQGNNTPDSASAVKNLRRGRARGRRVFGLHMVQQQPVRTSLRYRMHRMAAKVDQFGTKTKAGRAARSMGSTVSTDCSAHENLWLSCKRPQPLN